MNIFVLDECPVKSAHYHCDKHVVKMILEMAQIMCTAHRQLGTPLDESSLYKQTHIHHPCTKWVMDCSFNYDWVYRYFIALCDEYSHRYNKVHKCDGLYRGVLDIHPSNISHAPNIDNIFVICDKGQPRLGTVDKAVMAYQELYRLKKNTFKMVWTDRDIPVWL